MTKIAVTDDAGNVQEYESTADRVKRFREKHPVSSGWRIVTEIEQLPSAGSFVHRARIIGPESDLPVATGVVLQTGASSLNFESFAVGRALFYAGFGEGEIVTHEERSVREQMLTPGELYREKRLRMQAIKAAMHLDTSSGMNGERQLQLPQPADPGTGLPPGFQPPNPTSLPIQTPSLDPADYNLPPEIGLGLEREGDHVIVTETKNGVIYNNRQRLKENGFTFNGQTKKWSHPLIEAGLAN